MMLLRHRFEYCAGGALVPGQYWRGTAPVAHLVASGSPRSLESGQRYSGMDCRILALSELLEKTGFLGPRVKFLGVHV